MIARLPYWVLTDSHPAIYEADSKTAVQMVAKVYGKIQELVDDYNKFVDIINKSIQDYETGNKQDLDEFKENLTKLIHDYIGTLDMKVQHQDRQIAETVTYFKDNLKQAVTDITTEMKESGELENAIINGFDNLGGRVITLENSYLEVDSRLDNLEESKIEVETRLNSLENSSVKVIYNSESESLNFENVEVKIV